MTPNITIIKSFFDQKRYQEVIEACTKILTVNSKEIDALKLIAKTLFILKQFEEARTFFNKILNLEHNNFEIVKDLGNLSQAEGVAELISSENAESHKLAMQQMRGGFSNEIQVLRNKLGWGLPHVAKPDKT